MFFDLTPAGSRRGHRGTGEPGTHRGHLATVFGKLLNVTFFRRAFFESQNNSKKMLHTLH